MITTIFGLVAIMMLIKVLINFSKKEIHTGEFIIWSFAWLTLLILSFIPQISTALAGYVGLTRGIDLIVITSIIALMYLNYGLNKRIDKLQSEMTTLVRKLSKK